MTRSVYVVVALFLGVLLYVVLRRRNAPQQTDRMASPAQEPLGNGGMSSKDTTGLDDQRPADAFLKPATLTKSVPPLTKPRTGPSDSGSSHPAYPVAPAKYAEYMPKGGSPQRRETAQPSQATMRAAVPQAAKPLVPNPTASVGPESQAAAPWYPEPPANYTESGTDSQRASVDEDPELPLPS